MIIYIEVSKRTKDELERLLEAGGYRDYSEAVSIAIANQLLLHTHANENSARNIPPALVASTESALPEKSGKNSTPQVRLALEVPPLFSHISSGKCPHLAAYPNDAFAVDRDVPVDRWIFGQHNKLLPVKATCRALARLMSTEGEGNLSFPKTASTIASEAVKLGDYLRHLDETSGVHRDDALSFAFPYTDSPNGDKSRLRYANQFVASFTRQGSFTGLPFELKLVNRDQSRTPHILLTEAGWRFAEMRNPILDEGQDARQSRFSIEEIEFLVAHIRSLVPAEAFAYKVVLESIAQGAKTPDKLDDALEEYLPQREEKPYTRAYLTTQRAGVVSRMVDLGLVQRIRDGINVSYAATAKTFESSPNPLRKVV